MDTNYLSDDDDNNSQHSNTFEMHKDIDNIAEDDENIYINIEDLNDEDIELLNDEEKEEILNYKNMIANKLLNTNIDYDINKITNINNNKIIKINIKKSMNLKEFRIHIDKLIEKSKPLKFTSDRVKNKKNNEPERKSTIDPTLLLNERKFNPRLPPYFKSNMYKPN